MAKNLLEILIKFTKTGTGDKDAKSGLDKLGSGFKSLTGFSLGSATALGVAGIALKKMADFTRESVTETVEYNKQIREMSQVTGLGAEEISRIVQVGDDWGISLESLRTSLAFMNKQGISPSIDNLAKLADEYVNSKDKAAFAEKAVKTLGRGYQTLIPLLALGGKGFREAAAGIDDSLIATEKSIKASRKYEVAMDNLQDSATGLKYTLGNQLLPAIIDVTEGLNKLLTETMDVNDAHALAKKAYDAELITLEEYKGIMDDVRTRTFKNNRVLQDLIATEKAYIKYSEGVNKEEAIRRGLLYETNEEIEDAIPLNIDLADRVRDLTNAYIEGKDEPVNYALGLDSLTIAIGGVAGGFDEAKLSTELLNDALGILGETAIEQARLALVLEIATGNLSAAEIEAKLDSLDRLAVLEDINEALSTRAIDEYDWLKIMANGKTTRDELNKALGITADTLDDVELSTGNAKTALEGVPGAMTPTTESLNTAAEKAGALALKIDNSITGLTNLNGKVANVTINTFENIYRRIYDKGERDDLGANGLDFVVPPGYPNDSYIIGVQSGEHVVVTPSGTTNNFNINLASQGSASQDIKSTVRLMELLYG